MRGFTLMELMMVTAILAVVAASMGGIASVLHRTDRQTAAYVEDLGELRRAVRTVERDLYAAREIGYYRVDGVVYRRAGTDLLRDGKVVARNIALFEFDQEDGIVTVRVGLAQRAHVPGRPRPVVTTRVRPRNLREER